LIISHKYKFIFIKTKKTAGTSIEVYLSNYCADNDIVTPIYPKVESHIPRNYKGITFPVIETIKSNNIDAAIKIFKRSIKCNKYYNHIPAYRVKNNIMKKIWDDYFKFCVERNPWDKVVSLYHLRQKPNNYKKSFIDFIQNSNLPLNYPLYTSKSDKVIVDRVIKYENLNGELSTVFKRLGVPFSGELQVKAKSNFRTDRRHYQEYYNDNTREIIKNTYSKEIELHGYRF